MEKILIINLNRNGDIFSTAHLVHSLKENNPSTEISILVYKEFSKAAKCLKHISNIFTIDRKKILTFKKNKIFSHGHGINELHSSLKILKVISWDNIVNYSNSMLGSYILSFLNPRTYTGIGITTKGVVKPSNSWSLIFNEVLPHYEYTPIHFTDIYHKMLNISWKDAEIKLHTLPENNKLAYQNINILRKKINQSSQERKIIGIQLKSSNKSKDIPKKVIIDLLHIIFKDTSLYPILLVSPSQDEKNLSNEINLEFNNKVISVEGDFLAITSVLMNIDLLVTPDTSIKHIADLVSTPMVEISLGTSPLRKQGTANANNIVLSPINRDSRKISQTKKSQEQSKDIVEEQQHFPLTANDIYLAMNKVLKRNISDGLSLSPGITMYRSQRDDTGIWYQPIAGDINAHYEISVDMSRLYTQGLFSKDYNFGHIFNNLEKNYTKEEIFQWIDYQKTNINTVVKNLLKSIQILRSLKNFPNNGKEFVKALDGLLGFCSSNSIVAIPCLLFRSKVDSITSNTLEDNIKDMENLLFELKDHIQNLTKTISDLSSLNYKSRGEEGIKVAHTT